MKACSYCGRQSPDEATNCVECGTCFKGQEPEAKSPSVADYVPSPPPDAMADLDMDFDVVEGFSRPRWQEIQEFVEAHASKEELPAAWNYIGEKWVEQLSVDLGGGSRVRRSEHFLCVSDLDRAAADSTLRYAESSLRTVRDCLGAAAWTGYFGRHVLLLFADRDDYFAYISYYYGEGSHALSSGVFIGTDYAHVALPYSNARATEHALVHELVHNLLCHLRIPSWLNEGLAMVIERRILRYPFPVDQELVGRHAGYWNERNIQAFWAGTSFDEPGLGSELSYSLAEIFVALLMEKQGVDFSDFIQNADYRDAGQDAALGCLGSDLGDLAAGFLGPGKWRPQRKAIAEAHAGAGAANRR